MKDISPLPSNIQPFGTGVTDKSNRSPGNVVMISSHPEWPGRHELCGDNGNDGEIADRKSVV